MRDLAVQLGAGQDPVIREVYQGWDVRLEAASRLLPNFILTEAAGKALDDLAHAHTRTEDVDVLLEWMDLLPQNALALVDVAPVVYRSRERRLAQGLVANMPPASPWESPGTASRREAAVA